MQYKITITAEDAKADKDINDIIQAECKDLSESECLSNKRCYWEIGGSYGTDAKCYRNAKSVTAEEQEKMSKLIIGRRAPHVAHPPLEQKQPTGPRARQQQILLSTAARSQQFQKSHDDRLLPNERFVVKEISLDDPILERLADTHFLKQRKIQLLSKKETDDRLFRRTTSPITYGIEREYSYIIPDERSPFWLNDNAEKQEAEFVEGINKLPIFLYAHEVPVQVVSPERYKDQIGTISFIPDTKIPFTLHLQENETGKEFSVYMEKPGTTTYRASPGWSQPTKSADYVTYTADEKNAHPPLKYGQHWKELDNGLYTILTYAGGGGGGSRRSRRSRRITRNVRKHNRLGSRKRKQCKQYKRARRSRTRRVKK